MHGEAGLKDDFQGGGHYESWNFYNEKFGIYDEDPEIVTLSRADFDQSVVDSDDLYFVNFYSTFCSHCHDLAPTVSFSPLILTLQYCLINSIFVSQRFCRQLHFSVRIGGCSRIGVIEQQSLFC